MSTARIERRLLWHPRQENKFVVGGGSQITLYEWFPESSEIKQSTSLTDLQLMKCFAWSPHPSFDDLVAIGQTVGKVELVRLEATKYARDNVVSGGRVVSLPMRSSRTCNALGFSSHNPNLLAVGLDKVKGDPSLVVWDIEVASSVLRLARGSDEMDNLHTKTHPPSSKAGASQKSDSRIIHNYAPTDVVTSVAFLPQSGDLLAAGVSHRWLRIYDLRRQGSDAAQSVASQFNNIATDPFDQHRIACFGDNRLTIWDARRLSQPLLLFTDQDASADGARAYRNVPCSAVEFSRSRRGLLASLQKDAHHVRFWDIRRAPVVEFEQTLTDSRARDPYRDSSQSSKLSRLSWAAPSTILPWTAPTEQPRSPKEPPPNWNTTILADTRHTKPFNGHLMSFALVPKADPDCLDSKLVVVNKEGDIEMYAFHDTPKHPVWSARGEFAIGAGTSYSMTRGIHDLAPPLEPWDITQFNAMPDKSQSLEGLQTRGDAPGRRRMQLDPSELAGFNKSDLNGFPPLMASRRESSLTATRHMKGRTYSPASIRKYALDQTQEPDVTAESSRPASKSIEQGSSRVRSMTNNDNQRLVPDNVEAYRRSMPLARTGIRKVVEDDISLVMRSRAIRGYALLNGLHNAALLASEPYCDVNLAELWSWVNYSVPILSNGASRVHGFDFAYQGVLGIWEGLEPMPLPTSVVQEPLDVATATSSPDVPSTAEAMLSPSQPRNVHHRSLSPPDTHYGNFHAAVSALNSRRGLDKASWKPAAHTSRAAQRRLAFALCGWIVGDDELQRWEQEGKHPQAACWLLFANQHSKAIETLMRSKDDTHQVMSGALAALIFQHGSGSLSRNHELRDHYQRLMAKLQDPYFRIMLSYIVFEDWEEILDEAAVPLRGRLSLALRFLDDKALTTYLRRMTDMCRRTGIIDGLILTGLTPRGMDILQCYVDMTGDIQTAAIVSSLVSPLKWEDLRVGIWVEAYRDLLDGWRLFHYRCQFDIDRGSILQEGMQAGDLGVKEWVPRQFLIRCNYCNKSISPRQEAEPGMSQKQSMTACPACGRPLPRCSVCLLSIDIVSDTTRDSALLHASLTDTIDSAVVFCQTCRHGGHASHIIEWFLGGQDEGRERRACPVADCDCLCNENL